VSFTPPKNIVLAVDFEEVVYHKNLDALRQVVNQFDAALSVLHVEKKEAGLSWGEVSVKMQLTKAMSKLNYTFEKIENDNTEQGILSFVSSHPTDMLAMIAHQHSFLARLFRNIHTPSVSFQIHLPLLVLKN
jgi:putative NIF3 family GTP cyclohydrolase 1 type 2